jgi:signal transduction histidine kinase
MVDPEFQDSLRRALANAAGSEGPTVLEIMTHKVLGSRWLRFYYDVKQRDEEGNPRLGVGLLLDIDKQKRQEIALAEAQQEAEFANRTKTEFLANMSHELRTPLNAILGFSEMISLRTFGPIGAKYLEYAQDIHTSGQLLLDLVNDVLDLSKLEAGKLELHTTNIDLSSLGPECLALLKARAASNKITLINNIPAGIPLLNADERSVRQILLNFLSNAVKFTPEGGQVELSATVDISGGIVLSVKDSGIGMTPTEAKVALSPFGQIDSEIARKHQGTGLGLPICKSLMELHDGRLTIISKPGQGTSLIAHFPVGRTIVQKAGLTGISAD